MKPIGGFFELDISEGEKKYHKTPIVLSTGRSCLNLIIQEVKPSRIYLPYYVCDSLLQPIVENNIDYEFYEINKNLEPKDDIDLKKGEYLLIVNYFGIKSVFIRNLQEKYGANLIVDNTHAFYENKVSNSFSFNSARKFFGVPDGAYLYSPIALSDGYFDANMEISINHLVERMTGKLEQGYKDFLVYEQLLTDDIKSVSDLSKILLSSINYDKIALIRKRNFEICQREFQNANILDVSITEDSVPMVYPLMIDLKVDKESLYKDRIFIPTYWKDVLDRDASEKYKLEKQLSQNLLALPIDQRYGDDDMNRLIDVVRKKMKSY